MTMTRMSGRRRPSKTRLEKLEKAKLQHLPRDMASVSQGFNVRFSIVCISVSNIDKRQLLEASMFFVTHILLSLFENV